MVSFPLDPRHLAIAGHLRTLVRSTPALQVRVYDDSHMAVITRPEGYYSISFVPMVGGEEYFVLAVNKRSVRYPEMWEVRGDEVTIVDAQPGQTLGDLVYAYIAANPG